MNCNCCNCSSNNSCEEKNSKIKIYGTLVNVTLDNTLDDANCAADNIDYATGHNDALAYAYQLHDGRFRADDENLPAHERFQDAINRRLTNITYDPVTNTTTIEGNVVIQGQDGESYDDAWLKDIIGTTPTGEQSASELLQGDFTEESGDIISYIRLLHQKLCDLQQQVNNLNPGSDTNTCLWTIDQTDNYLMPNCNCSGVKGPGFYDTEVR